MRGPTVRWFLRTEVWISTAFLLSFSVNVRQAFYVTGIPGVRERPDTELVARVLRGAQGAGGLQEAVGGGAQGGVGEDGVAQGADGAAPEAVRGGDRVGAGREALAYAEFTRLEPVLVLLVAAAQVDEPDAVAAGRIRHPQVHHQAR